MRGFLEDVGTVLWFFFIGLPLVVIEYVFKRGHYVP